MRKMRFLRSYKWILFVVALFAICIGLRLVVLSLRTDYLEIHRLKLSNRQSARRWSYLPVHVVEEHHEGKEITSISCSFIQSCKITQYDNARNPSLL